MSTTAAPTGAPKTESPYVKAFFADKPADVALFIDPKNPAFEAGRPAMFGTIGGKSVSVFVEPAGEKEGKPYGAFMSINEKGPKTGTDAEGKDTYAADTKLGKGNVVVANAQARLAIKIGEETIWATPRKEVSLDQLTALGLDNAKLNEARATKAAEAAAAPEKAAPKP